jgi:hypothetical protein
VSPQIEAVHHVVEIALNLRLWREVRFQNQVPPTPSPASRRSAEKPDWRARKSW